jgi:hypothetical protein
MNAEATANDFERPFRRWIGWPGYHGNRGFLYRIGNVSWGHRLIHQAFLVGIDAVLPQDRRGSLHAI